MAELKNEQTKTEKARSPHLGREMTEEGSDRGL